MIYFAAGNFPQIDNAEAEERMARRMLDCHSHYSRLISYYYWEDGMNVIRLKSLQDISNKVKIMLDSGAFSAHTQNEEIDFDGYMAFIDENHTAIDFYINLDIIGDGEASLNNYNSMKENRFNPVPVYHATTDEKYLAAYIEQADYVAISRVGITSTDEKIRRLDYLWDEYLTDERGYAKLKVHGLGISVPVILFRYPWYSVDGTAWVSNLSNRKIIVIDEEGSVHKIFVSSEDKDKRSHINNLEPTLRKQLWQIIRENLLKLNL